MAEGGQGMDAGRADVADGAGLGVGDPDREPAWQGHRLDIGAVAVFPAGVPQVDWLAPGSLAPIS